MSSSNGPKYNLNRFRRIPSQHSADQTYLNPNESLNQNSTRTISSGSTSILSTPSNNIRRIQQQKQQLRIQREQKDSKEQRAKRPSMMSRPSNVKNKLLNLQSLKKFMTDKKGTEKAGTQAFAIRKPLDMNAYDYSVFTNYSNDSDMLDDDSLPPAVKESQVKAWESAEKITNNLIFNDTSSESDDDSEVDGEPKDTKEMKHRSNEIIQSLPGYTKGELCIIQTRFNDKQKQGPNVTNFGDDEEKQLLWDYRKRQQATQEKLFSQYLSLSNKRKIQLAQKKDLLYKMFGYNNNINQEYVTNNTPYSAIDNAANSLKAFHEDKEEICLLIDEDRLYHQLLHDTKASLNSRHNNRLGINKRKLKKIEITDFDYDKFQSIVSFKLDHLYDRFFVNYNCSKPADMDDDDEVSEELYNFTTAFLRRCMKDTDEIEDSM